MTTLFPRGYGGIPSYQFSSPDRFNNGYYYGRYPRRGVSFAPHYPSQPLYQPPFNNFDAYPAPIINQYRQPGLGTQLVNLFDELDAQYRYEGYLRQLEKLRKQQARQQMNTMPLTMYPALLPSPLPTIRPPLFMPSPPPLPPPSANYPFNTIYQFEKETKYLPYPVYVGPGGPLGLGFGIGNNLGQLFGPNFGYGTGGNLGLPPKVRVIFIPAGQSYFQQPYTGSLAMPPFLYNRIAQPLYAFPLPPPLPQIASLPLTPAVQQMVMQRYSNPVAVLPFTPNWQMPSMIMPSYPMASLPQQQCLRPVIGFQSLPPAPQAYISAPALPFAPIPTIPQYLPAPQAYIPPPAPVLAVPQYLSALQAYMPPFAPVSVVPQYLSALQAYMTPFAPVSVVPQYLSALQAYMPPFAPVSVVPQYLSALQAYMPPPAPVSVVPQYLSAPQAYMPPPAPISPVPQYLSAPQAYMPPPAPISAVPQYLSAPQAYMPPPASVSAVPQYLYAPQAYMPPPAPVSTVPQYSSAPQAYILPPAPVSAVPSFQPAEQTNIPPGIPFSTPISAFQSLKTVPQSYIPPITMPVLSPPSLQLPSSDTSAISSSSQYSYRGYPSMCRACPPAPPPLNIPVTGHCWVQHCCACHNVPTVSCNPNVRPNGGRITPLLRYPTVPQYVPEQINQQEYFHANAPVMMRPWLRKTPPLPPGAVVISDQYISPTGAHIRYAYPPRQHRLYKNSSHNKRRSVTVTSKTTTSTSQTGSKNTRSVSPEKANTNNRSKSPKNIPRNNRSESPKKIFRNNNNNSTKQQGPIKSNSTVSTSSTNTSTSDLSAEYNKRVLSLPSTRPNTIPQQLTDGSRNINLQYKYQSQELSSVYLLNRYLKSSSESSTLSPNSEARFNDSSLFIKERGFISSPSSDSSSIKNESKSEKEGENSLRPPSQPNKSKERLVIIREFRSNSPSTISTISSDIEFSVVNKDEDTISTTSTIKANKLVEEDDLRRRIF